MFGSKKEKDGDLDQTTPRSSTENSTGGPAFPSQPKLQTDGIATSAETNSPVGKSEDASLTKVPSPSTPVTESKKRRGSSTAKAKEIFSQAKNSLIHGDKDGPQTPMQKLSKTDAALSVPQGDLNNSAGQSHPTANSSFLVGVTEDKNKKCRRTMEDTHAYLYNFLGTPAPVLPSQASTKSRRSLDNESRLSQVVTAQSDQSQHVVETDNGYFAVFDGHAGSFAAEWCGKKIHVLLEDLMRKNPNTPVPELLDQTYTSADQQLERLPLKNSGCTAITAVLRWEDRVPNGQSATGSQAIAPLAAQALKKVESESASTGETLGERKASTAEEAIQEVKQKATRQRVLYTANVGDARIVLCRNGKALRLSYDHKGADENEGRRISKAGGLILNNRVNGVLAVTRALGDSYLKDLVTGHPYTTETVIQPDQDEFLILACDGLWDVTSDQEAVDIIRNVQDPQQASKILVDHALARFSTDNLSVMIVRFDPSKLASNTATDIGVETDPANKEKGAVSEVEMIVGEARRNSGIAAGDPVLNDGAAEDVNDMIIAEDEEPGPELTPEGGREADKIFQQQKRQAEAQR